MEKITTQKLHEDKPGDVFAIVYSILIELTQGKIVVNVRSQPAETGDLAGSHPQPCSITSNSTKNWCSKRRDLG
jgi:hypothetical protein